MGPAVSSPPYKGGATLQGWSDVTWSLRAVVKMAPSTTMAYRMVGGLTPPAFIRGTHSRTCCPRRSPGDLPPRSSVSHLSTSPADILRHTPVASNLEWHLYLALYSRAYLWPGRH